MQVFDEIYKKWVDMNSSKLIVKRCTDDLLEFGYTSKLDNLVKLVIKFNGDMESYYTDLSIFKGSLFFSKLYGVYMSSVNLSEQDILIFKHQKGCGSFPYILRRKYEAIDNFKYFEGRQVLLDDSKKHPISKYLQYTFGLEFETSQGYIPEDICYRDGLIPLRDGSISGIEYSTVVLKENRGISLLKQQLETLKEYTAFNKECSLHIHLGNFPLNTEAIFNLYCICVQIEEELESILPKYTFYSNLYKQNGKSYCQKLLKYNSFNSMYEDLVGLPFKGTFTKAHPNDISRDHKWLVNKRYFWCNFINILCYKVNKTIEFRFLRPTYNFKKILLWLYIFNGILKYAEIWYSKNTNINLTKIINTCYPEDIALKLRDGLSRLKALSINQLNNGDKIGAEVWMEDSIFNDLDI